MEEDRSPRLMRASANLRLFSFTSSSCSLDCIADCVP